MGNEGQSLQDIVLPENWKWSDETTVISKTKTEYPAHTSVDDVTYDYSNVEGYNEKGHYVERMVTVTVEPVITESAEPVQEKSNRSLGYTPTAVNAGDIEINDTNFPDKEFRDWLKTQPYGTDGKITQAEIARITDMPVGGKTNIEDLTGIEHFTALTALYCYNTGISDLDVSNNTQLTQLLCHDNGKLAKLTVAGATELTHLDCSNTGITSLDVSKNTQLTGLICSDTPLAYLNIGENKGLTVDKSILINPTVYVATDTFMLTDKFSGIDITKISNLTGADWNQQTGKVSNFIFGTPITYDYDCGTSKAGKETLNVTLTVTNELAINAINFPDEAFRTWIGQQNYGQDGKITKDEIADITEIRVIENLNIEDLTGIEHFTALTRLNCYTTGITSLDVSKNTKLTELYCRNTGITSLDVSNNTNLTFLDCSSTGISELDVSKNTQLTGLYCYNTGISDLNVSNNTALTHLTCYYTGITSLDVSNNTALTRLYCDNTGITSLDVSNNTALTVLDCHKTPLAYLNIGANNSLTIDKTNLKPVSLEITEDSFNMADKFNGIELGNVTNVSGADYKNGIMSNYDVGTPITYTYGCGTSKNGAQTIDVTLNLTGSFITITDDMNKTYDGIAVNATPNVIKTGSSGEVTFMWEKKVNDTNWESITFEPTDAGTYRVTATLASDSNYKGAISKPKEFTISQAESTIDVSANLDKPYDGTAVSTYPSITKTGSTSEVSYKWEKKVDDTNWEEITFEPTDAGTYRVTATLESDNNYKGATSEPYEFTISKADSTIFITDELNKTYDKTTVNAMPNVSTTGSCGPVRYYWKKKVNGTWKAIASAPTDAGTYRVTASLTSDSNYKGATNTKDFVISQATNSWINDLAITDWTFGDQPNDPTAKAMFGDKINYLYSDSEKGIYTDKVPTTAGTWYVKATVAGTENYTGLESIKKFEITKANDTWVEGPAILDWVFGEAPNTPTAKAKSDGTVNISYSSSEKGTYTDKVPTNAGTWYMKATVADSNNYNGLESIVSFTIAPKNADNNSQIIIPDINSDKDVENLVIKDGDKELEKGTDYDVDKKQNGNEVIVSITFKGNYTGTITKTYTVNIETPKDEPKETASIPTGDNTHTGLLAMISLLSASCVTFLTGKKKKKRV